MPLIIGITHSYEDNFAKLNTDYLKMVSRFGATSLIIPYSENPDSILDIVDGVILSGGGDLSQYLIYEELSPKAKNIYPNRDIFEAKLCICAYRRNIPLLGICRGIQVMNTAFGGEICQHTDGHTSEYSNLKSPNDTVTHKIKIEKDSQLYKIAQAEYMNVNSFHHQCLKTVAPCFKISAKCEDSVIEAIESHDCDFFMGVQWHPEKNPDDMLSIGIFKEFINASACRKS